MTNLATLIIDRSTFPGSDVAPEELEFLKAMEKYQRVFQRRYPTWREVLFIAHCLGYRKVAEPTAWPTKVKGSRVPVAAVGE